MRASASKVIAFSALLLAINASHQYQVFVRYQDEPVGSIDIDSDRTITDLINVYDPDLFGAVDVRFQGEVLSEKESLSDAGIGGEAVVEFVDRNDIQILFNLLENEQENERLLGFKNYDEFNNRFPLDSEKTRHLSNCGVTLMNGTMNVTGITWDGDECHDEGDCFRMQTFNFEATRHLRVLDKLNLDNNVIKGSLDVASLPSNLTKLVLSWNQLSGPIDLAAFSSSLEVLDLEHNAFNGSIDLSSAPKGLKVLMLNSNEFSGSITLSQLPQELERLESNRNHLSGCVDLLSLPANLRYLSLGRELLNISRDMVLPRNMVNLHFRLRIAAR